MLALANDGDELWAIGTQRPVASGTQPATFPSTSQPAPDVAATPSSALMLYALKGDTWTSSSGTHLPTEIFPDTPVSLAIINHVPWLAVGRADNSIAVLRQVNAGWETVAQFVASAEPHAFKLFSGSVPSIWMADSKGSRLEILHPGAAHKVIPLKGSAAPLMDQTATYANKQFRGIAVVDGKLVEQDYDPQTFQLMGKPSAVALPAPAMPSLNSGLFRLGLTAAVVFAVLTSAWRRRDAAEESAETENLVLADLGRRFIAGLIDAIPFTLPLVFFLQFLRLAGPDPQNPTVEAQHALMLSMMTGVAAFLVYLIHTAVSETLTGRTLGKMLLGLRVVSPDGSTPDASSLIIRNFLRVVDIGLVGVPLVFILFSPLRQRIGDVAASTIVIRDRVRPEGNRVDPEKSETEEEGVAAEPPAAAGE